MNICGFILSTLLILSGDVTCPQGVIIDGGVLDLNGFTLHGKGGTIGVILRGEASRVENGRIAGYYVGIHKQPCAHCEINNIIVKAFYPLLEDK